MQQGVGTPPPSPPPAPPLCSCALSDEDTTCSILFNICVPQGVYLGLRWVFFFFFFQRFSIGFDSVLPLQIDDALENAWGISKAILRPMLHAVRFCFGLCLLFYGMAFRTLAFHIIVLRLSGLRQVKNNNICPKYLVADKLSPEMISWRFLSRYYLRQSTSRKKIPASYSQKKKCPTNHLHQLSPRKV